MNDVISIFVHFKNSWLRSFTKDKSIFVSNDLKHIYFTILIK